MRNNFACFYLLVIVAKCLVECDAVTFKGRIAGDRTIFECVNGYEPTAVTDDAKNMFITTSQLAKEAGYPAKEYVVQTDDGYILTIHRIPGKAGAPPVFLQHGLLGSSFDWLLTGKNKALAFKLADEGYDVWMGNVRGNTYSRCHTKYETSESQFWDFSWHEIAIYDLPTMITDVTNTTGQKIIYVGYSMGTTAFFVMAIERPDIASKVKLMMALAPIAFMGDGTSLLQFITPYAGIINFLVDPFKKSEFLSFAKNSFAKVLLKYVCTLSKLQQEICASLLFSTAGYNSGQFNYTLLPDILYHFPAGSSIKALNHYFQATASGRFQQYDYGSGKNLKVYNSSEPPDYDISKINVPVGLIWSDSDVFTYPTDVMRLYEQLPNVVLNYRLPYPEFQHHDFLYGIQAPKLVYKKLISFINNYR